MSTADTGSGGATESVGDGRREAEQPPTNLRRAAVWMAAGTAVSRFTGVLRVLALAFALGATHLATSYNLANTTPNMLYDVVLGGVLSATFIPVFVDRLATRSEREAWRAISSVITLSVAVLVAMTVVFWLLSGQVIDAFTALDHTHSAVQSAGLDQERAVATSLLRWFVPQVALYGLIALATALLNTRRRFIAPMWVPIANNVVCIVVLLWFHHLVPDFPSLAGVEAHQGQLILLGLGTTLGVALQAVLLLPSLRAARLSRLRWRWDPRHEAVRTIVRLGSWTFGFVVANQVALFVILALAVGVPASDPVSSYTYAYTFMQMPYAVVAVSVMSAVTPDLAQQWATGDMMAFRRRLAGGLRAVLAIILPAAMGMFLLAKPAVALLLGHGATSVSSTEDTGAALALFSLGLPGFCTFLYVVRVLQSMQRTRGRVLALPRRERHQHRLRPGARPSARRQGPCPVALDRLLDRRRRWHRRPPSVARRPRRWPDVGTAPSGRRRHRGDGRRRSDRLEPVRCRPRLRSPRSGRRRGHRRRSRLLGDHLAPRRPRPPPRSSPAAGAGRGPTTDDRWRRRGDPSPPPGGTAPPTDPRPPAGPSPNRRPDAHPRATSGGCPGPRRRPHLHPEGAERGRFCLASGGYTKRPGTSKRDGRGGCPRSVWSPTAHAT